MIKKRLLSKLIAGIMVFSLLMPLTVSGTETGAYDNWNAERYGDRVDIDAKLDKLSKDDSFLMQAENKIKEQADDSRLYSSLGIAYAGLGLKEKAVLAATRATEILPVSKEYWRGIYRVKDLAQVYVMVGEYDRALDQIEYLLSIPGELSVGNLKIDPVWAPLRTLPRFQELLEKYA